ncbi:Ig-like domain-containing protein [Clostridium sp. LBM24168]
MKNFTKNFLMFCGIYISIQLVGHASVFAASSTIDKLSEKTATTQTQQAGYIDTDINEPKKVASNLDINSQAESTVVTKDSIPVTKAWKIKFNEPVDINILSDKIKLINKQDNTEVPISITSDNICQTITVTSSNNLEPQTEYVLSVSKDIISKFGKPLSNPTIVDFKTSTIISSIDDINKTVDQGDDFSLGSTVNAIMSDGTISQVDVSWDKSSVNTNIPGSYTFKGTVPEYGTITLNLTIKPFEPVSSISNGKATQSSTGIKLYNYLMDYKNRNDVLERAIKVHAAQGYGDNPSSNNCVFYQSEALRSIGINILNSTANTVSLTNTLLDMGWKKSSDLSLLLPGDICFTIEYGNGPTHTYTFMKWVDPKHFDYAYICDNQGNEYGNDAYHKRNINFQTDTKDKIAYFLYPTA